MILFPTESNFSMKPLTLMWFLAILVVLLFTFLLSALGPRQNPDSGKPCTSVSHLTVAAIYIAIVFIVTLWSKRWIVQREIAGAGTGSPAATNTTYWSVLDLPQTKVGGGILSTVCFAAFGATWYGQCSSGK
jgi:amino acid transporter